MKYPGAILLISCYELGRQPLSLASPLATLRSAGYQPTAIDTTVMNLSDELIQSAQLIAIATPMHTALRLGIRVAARARSLNTQAHICFYGLYASLNSDYLLRTVAHSTIGGEYEDALLALAQALEVDEPLRIEGVSTREAPAAPVLRRIPFVAPARDSLPGPDEYAHLVRNANAVKAGYVEASRGCLHTCLHCPITPVYGGRFFIVPRQVVLDDIRAQVKAGVEHVTFGDPDFLNGPKHALAIVRALHDEFPGVTFDATIKVEHILERRELFPELAELGCLFVVSAVESLSDDVLRHLGKGHTREDVAEALDVLRSAGIYMRPTFVAFTPWTTARDYLDLLDFVAAHDLVDAVDPIQFAIRLLLPPGSALLGTADTSQWLGSLDEEALTYRWTHPDPRMDALHLRVTALVESSAATNEDAAVTFERIRDLAEDALAESQELRQQRILEREGVRLTRQAVPHLTEAWFC